MPDYKPLVYYRALPFDGSFPVTGPFLATSPTPPWAPANPHLGKDFGCPSGTPLFSPVFGRMVSLTVDNGSFGTYAGIDCTTRDGEATEWYMLMAHMSSRAFVLGEQVQPGTLLGYSGATGFVDGAHLHWQMCRNDLAFPRDPSIMADPTSFPVESLSPPTALFSPAQEAEIRRMAREEASIQFNAMNAALQNRMSLERLSNLADNLTVDEAVAVLKEEGLL
jgi:murein DD-endopeptidase MepM/ murein hydrolase activator NlpD